MTTQKLYETLKFIKSLDSQLRLQSNITAIRTTLDNLVGTPANPQHQSELAAALVSFTSAAQNLTDAIGPSQAIAIASMGGEEFFDPSIAKKVQASISSNAMTPSVARDFVKTLETRRAAFLATVESTLAGLEKLGVGETDSSTGAADLSFLIPRDLFSNHLDEFAKELIFISRLMKHISEGITGNAKPVELGSLSSSIPTIALAASLPAIAALATIVNKFLEGWERIQKIRKMRDDLLEMGLKGSAVEELTEQVTTTVDEMVEESTELVLVRFNGHEEGRKNELKNAISQDVRRLFGQIERGLTVEFRTDPDKAAEDEDQRNLIDTVAHISRQMKFPPVPREPLLLGMDEIVEGDIRGVKVVKKSSTHKTVTTKKTAPKQELKA
jgi:hypothetical protein